MYGEPDKVHEVEDALRDEYRDKATGKSDDSIEELINDGGTYAKLYGLDIVLKNLGPHYPDVLMVLTGYGEEQDDIWEFRVKDYHEEFHKAEIPPFTNPYLEITEENHSKLYHHD